jgi:hypothetical protein
MNTNSIQHTDLIFSVTVDWVLLPIVLIGVATLAFFLHKRFRRQSRS